MARKIRFTSGQKFKVYQGPGEEYGQAGNGKAAVSTNDWIQVFGEENGWILIQYDINKDHMRIGWIKSSALPKKATVSRLTYAPLNAITSMTIQDAWSILKGEENAATEYLKRTTAPLLKEKFKPVIQNSLNKVNATKYYGDIVSRYNQIPLVEDVNPNLDDYATDKAIEGLFVMIAKEEKEIRKDPVARTTELLKRVFGYKK